MDEGGNIMGDLPGIGEALVIGFVIAVGLGGFIGFVLGYQMGTNEKGEK